MYTFHIQHIQNVYLQLSVPRMHPHQVGILHWNPFFGRDLKQRNSICSPSLCILYSILFNFLKLNVLQMKTKKEKRHQNRINNEVKTKAKTFRHLWSRHREVKFSGRVSESDDEFNMQTSVLTLRLKTTNCSPIKDVNTKQIIPKFHKFGELNALLAQEMDIWLLLLWTQVEISN